MAEVQIVEADGETLNRIIRRETSLTAEEVDYIRTRYKFNLDAPRIPSSMITLIPEQALAYKAINYLVARKTVRASNKSSWRTRWKREHAPHQIIKKYNNEAATTAASTALPADSDNESEISKMDELFDEDVHARKQRQAIHKLETEKLQLEQTIAKSTARLAIINAKLEKWAHHLIPAKNDLPPISETGTLADVEEYNEEGEKVEKLVDGQDI